MKAILTDVTRCVGCNKCVEACVRENHLAAEAPFRWREPDGLSAQRFTTVLHRSKAHIRKQCRHCLSPACVCACPVGALSRTAEGAVVYDSNRCLGCRYCMMACPFGIPRYDWASAAPRVRKCTLCWEKRVSQGLQPACTEACPEKATVFGDRDELLAEAHRRIAESPGRYLPVVYGEKEVGGTAVLYVSHVDLGFLGLGLPVGDEPMPERTATAMHAVPFAFLGMATLMGGLWWTYDRRQRLAAEREARNDKPAGEPAAAPAEARQNSVPSAHPEREEHRR